ncbi:MAG: hypothetical protein HY290_30510 [Planctomycetia bacterium]|nr:hypothetical protein [Planctomycetia bacterium]
MRGLDQDLTTVVLGEASRVPEICCSCGLATRRRILVKQWKPVGGDHPDAADDGQIGAFAMVFNALFGLFGGLFLHAFLKRSPHNRQWVCVPIMQCEACSENGPPQPLRVDFEYFTMRFVVHRNFQARVEDRGPDGG